MSASDRVDVGLQIDDFSGRDRYSQALENLRLWINTNLTLAKLELERLLWPIFVQSYIELVQEGDPSEAHKFLLKFQYLFANEHVEELATLRVACTPDLMEINSWVRTFRANRYRVVLSSFPYENLRQYLYARVERGGPLLLKVMTSSTVIKKTDSSGYNLDQLASLTLFKLLERYVPNDDEGITPAVEGSDLGDPQPPLTLGPLPMDAELLVDVRLELGEEDEREPPTEGRATLVEEFERHIKREAAEDSPSTTDLPMPPSSAADVQMEMQRTREHRARIKLEKSDTGLFPGVHICQFTLHNTRQMITCMDISGDSQWVAAGSNESWIGIWSVDGSVLPNMMPRLGEEPSSHRRLSGHADTVYSVAWSPSTTNDGVVGEEVASTKPRYLLSASADRNVHLWFVETWSLVVVYQGHNDTVWDVEWGPYGHYFLSGGRDRAARLWSVDQIGYLRMFVGHDKDVDVVGFHANGAYVFTASVDKTVRMWSVKTGEQVRVFRGHATAITTLECSRDGRSLASADGAGVIILWDLATGKRIKQMRGHGKGGIWSVRWSIESSVILSAGMDGTVRLWDVSPTTGSTVATMPPAELDVGQGLGDLSPDPQPPTSTADVSLLSSSSPSAGPAHTGRPVSSSNNPVITLTTSVAATATAGTGAGASTATLAAGTGGSKRKGKEVVVTSDQIAAFPTRRTQLKTVKFTGANLILAAGVHVP